ncbi:hypothetical protein BDV98DRAFT_585046 [Pterulicium gracile]|uniref:Uncharacterized protein n=1 Tax=Pterulicium gracile TaxID=1884261 RepID=A0A5C3Q9B6_9AGAR|nr:hypothetical protein BDV98DRAFT_585046 [Pterula gracilis]
MCKARNVKTPCYKHPGFKVSHRRSLDLVVTSSCILSAKMFPSDGCHVSSAFVGKTHTASKYGILSPDSSISQFTGYSATLYRQPVDNIEKLTPALLDFFASAILFNVDDTEQQDVARVGPLFELRSNAVHQVYDVSFSRDTASIENDKAEARDCRSGRYDVRDVAAVEYPVGRGSVCAHGAIYLVLRASEFERFPRSELQVIDLIRNARGSVERDGPSAIQNLADHSSISTSRRHELVLDIYIKPDE